MIVVTAPTGQIGRQVVADLLAAGRKLRLIVRDASKLPAPVRDSVEIVEGSHGDADVVERAFEGADAVFWVVPPGSRATPLETYIHFTRPASEALRRHSVARVVGVTSLGRGTPWRDKAGLATASLAMEDLLMATGVAYRGLAMPSFMENMARQAANIKDKAMFFGPLDPARKMPVTATRDMGTRAAQLLADDGWTGQEEVAVLGPEDLSMTDMAAIVSDVLGRAVRYQQIPFEAFKQQFLDRGLSEAFAQGYVDMYRAKDEGMDNCAKRDASSTTPTSFRQWCQEELKPLILR